MAAIVHTDSIRQQPTEAVLTVLGLSGVALVFLPFVGGDVPVKHFLQGLSYFGWRRLIFRFAILGPCVVLPFFISAGYLRWLLTGGLSRWEAAVGYALALIAVVLLSLVVILELWWDPSSLGISDPFFVSFFGALALGLGAGAWFVIQNLRHETQRTLTGLVAMQLAYLPFALGWLGALPVNDLIERDWGDIAVGAYLAVLAVLVYTTQAVLSVRGQPRWWLRVLPIGFVWAGGLAAGLTIH